MRCKNCGVELKADVKFCGSCGAKIDEKPQFSKLAEQIKDHLGFLGYTFEVISPGNEKGKPILLGKHNTEYKIAFWEPKDDIILFKILLTAKTKPSAALYEFANKLNQRYVLARALIEDGDPTASLANETLWIGEYSKDRFGVFIEQFRNDVRQVNSVEDAGNLL